MSIKKCLASLGIEVADGTVKEDALYALLDQLEVVRGLQPSAEFKGEQEILDYLKQLEDKKNKDSYNIENLYDPNAKDFMYIEDQNETTSGQPNSSMLFGNIKGITMTAEELLNNITTRFRNLSPEVSTIVEAMGTLLVDTRAKVKLISEARMPDGAFMQYDPNTNTILISKEKVDAPHISAERAATAALHEIVHSVTVHTYVKSNKTPKEQAFRQLIDEMYAKYKKLSGVGNLSFNERQAEENYGFKSPEEFIAEIMVNPKFQAHIRKLESNVGSNASLWTKFINFIRDLFGLAKNPEYNAIIDSITQAIANNSANPATEFEAMEMLNIEDPGPMYQEETVSKRLSGTLDTIKDNLDESIRRYDQVLKSSKDPERTKKYSDKLKMLLNTIENFDNTRQWAALAYYVSEINGTIGAIERAFENEDFDNKNINRTIHQYSKYLQSFALISDIQSLLADAFTERDDLPITKEELDTMTKSLTIADGKYNLLKKRFDAYIKKGLIKELGSDRQYAYEVIVKREQMYKQRHKELGMTTPVENYVNKMINVTDREEIDEEVQEHIRKIIMNPEMDISWATSFFNSGMNTNSRLIQLFQTIVNETRNNIIEKQRQADLDLRDLFEEFTAGKSGQKVSTLYEKMLEFDEEGQAYLKGEYSIKFKDQKEKLLAKYQKDAAEKLDKYGSNSAEYRNAYKESAYSKWAEANIVLDQNNQPKPADIWKNKTQELTDIEQRVLNKFKEITETAHDQTYGYKSLIEKSSDAQYYRLPSITKSDLERVTEGNLAGIIDDKWKNVTESIRPDDVGYEEGAEEIMKDKTLKEKVAVAAIGLDRKPIYRVKVNFRNRMKPNQQSLDLFTLYRLEMKNGINYEEKQQAEYKLGTLVDIAKEKKFYKSSGFRVPVLGRFLKRRKRLVEKGENTNTYAKLVSLMEQNVYDIMHKHAGKVGKFDINKTVRMMNGYTAALGMTLNEVTGVANVLNGKAQLFLEGIAGTFITRNALLKAEKIYFNTLIQNFKDVSSPIKSSFVNQLTEIMDTFGLISVSAKQGFIKNTFLKANGNFQSLQFIQEGGEHWLQSVLTMGIMDSIKVLNKNNELIDKNGKVVKSEKEAASLLDMYSMGKNGRLQLDPAVVYTTKSTAIPYDKGGKEKIQALVKKKIFDTMGNYDANMQPEAMRHWHGKLLMMYRKYLIPMGLARYRGMAYVQRPTEDLEDYQRFYSEALQLHEEGFYTTGVRYILTGVIPALRNLEMSIMTAKWDQLTDYEKGNIYKMITEIAITMAILPATALMIETAMAAGDDDEAANKLLYFLLLETTRLNSELSAYRDPREQYRITSSPIPALRTIENLNNFIDRLYNPMKMSERYKAGPRKGDLKVWKDVERLVPILNSTNITYKEKYQYIINMTQ